VSQRLPHCCQGFMMVHSLVFNFAAQFVFGCCSLAQEMSSVILCLLCFGKWVVAHCSRPSCLSHVCLLIVQAKIMSLPLPHSPVLFQLSSPLYCCTRLHSLFIVQFFCRGQSAQGLCWLFPGCLGYFHVTHDIYLYGLYNVS
jgi:hypothetical protein